MQRTRNLALVLAALALASPAAAQDLPPEVQKLRSRLEQAEDFLDVYDDLPVLAVDAGPAAVPILRDILSRDKGFRSEMAARGLAYIGGDAATGVLLQHYRATQDLKVKALLATAMASVRLTAENRAFLEECLKGKPSGDESLAFTSAALSLGVLRSSESREALERTAKKAPSSISSGAAEEALRWIAQGQWKVAIPSTARIEPPLEAVLRNGLPDTDEGIRYFDSDGKRVWSIRNATWTVEETATSQDFPGIGFNVHVSPDGKRALVSAGISYGLLAGTGYDYVLRREKDEWIVQSVFFTWIS